MLQQPMDRPPTGSHACAATVSHLQAPTTPSASCWYQHLDSLVIMEHLDSGPASVGSIVEALVPDGADSSQQHQQLDNQVATPAAYLPALTTAADAAALAGLYSGLCNSAAFSAHDQSDAVPSESALAAAACHADMPAAWPAATGAEGYHSMAEWWVNSGDMLGPTYTAATQETTECNTSNTPRNLQYPILTLTDAASTNSSPTSIKDPMHPSAEAAAITPAAALVPAKHSRSHSSIAAKPRAAAAAAARPPVCDTLAGRREVNKLSQRRQRYKRQQDIEEVRTQLSEMTDKHKAAKQQLDSLRSEQAALLSRLSDVTAKWQATVALNASLQRDNTAHQLQVADLQQQLSGMQAQLLQQQQPAHQTWTHVDGWVSNGVCWQQQQQHQQAALWG